MTKRVYNFSAGPAILPEPVLREAQDQLLSFKGLGMSVMEISHRSSDFEQILHSAGNGVRTLLDVPDNYEVLFLPGGATLQFTMVPLNFLSPDGVADHVVTGIWSGKALSAAKRYGKVNVAASTADDNFRSIPAQDHLNFSANADYIHYVSNETIQGVEFRYDLNGYGKPVICDASSNIMSKPIDITKYAMIYAGAQKNLGPSGISLAIISRELLERAVPEGDSPLFYRTYANNASMPNTPNTWGIYLIDLVCKWLISMGGVAAMHEANKKKAAIIYDAMDSSDGFYQGHAEKSARSLMNVTFRLPSEDLENEFCSKAEAEGMSGLKGHRSVGGIRASIYNAFPAEGAEALADLMRRFADDH